MNRCSIPEGPQTIEQYDGHSYTPQTGGSGKSAIFINSRWAFKATASYQFPLDINVSGYFSLREDFVHPIRVRSPYRDHFAGRVYPVVEPIGENHLPNLSVFDVRVEKVFRLQDFGRLGLIMDVFNVFNTDSTLGKNRNAYQSTFDQITEIVNPRLFRFAVRFQFWDNIGCLDGLLRGGILPPRAFFIDTPEDPARNQSAPSDSYYLRPLIN